MAYVYSHTRLDKNEIFYIGIGIKPNFARAYDKTNRTKWWRNITNKTEYKVDILIEETSREKAIIEEIRLIALYGRADLGLGKLVNLTNGGDGVSERIVTKETRDKISKFQKSYKKSPEHLAAFIKANKERGITPENREKMIEGRKGVELISKRKPIINIETLDIYGSVVEVPENDKFCKPHISSMIRGAKTNKTDLMYISDYKKLLIEKINHFFPEANLQV